jgi:hypothetical protein
MDEPVVVDLVLKIRISVVGFSVSKALIWAGPIIKIGESLLIANLGLDIWVGIWPFGSGVRLKESRPPISRPIIVYLVTIVSN